jgi:hypothetical protein
MSRSRAIIASLILISLLLLTVGSTAAKGGGGSGHPKGKALRAHHMEHIACCSDHQPRPDCRRHRDADEQRRSGECDPACAERFGTSHAGRAVAF